MLAAIVLISTLGTVGVVGVRHRMNTSLVTRCIAEIEEMQADIDSYYRTHDAYPRSLADVGHSDRLDPWGNPYEFLNYATVEKMEGARIVMEFMYHGTFDRRTGIRNDRNPWVLNTGYDLFSAGPDGEWKPPLDSRVSQDDIIRSRDGEFVGVAGALVGLGGS